MKYTGNKNIYGYKHSSKVEHCTEQGGRYAQNDSCAVVEPEKIIFDISESIVPDFVYTDERRFVSVIGISKNNKIVFVRSAEQDREWELPGGTVLAGESYLDAGKREFFEETGLHIQSAREVLKIENVYGKNKKVHSHVSVIAGIINDQDTIKCLDPEIAECTLFEEVPGHCTFGRDYIIDIISKAIDKFSVLQNQDMWGVAAKSYNEQTFISKEDVHYGPLLPGESSLHLLPLLNDAYVLDLGCGAGCNLAALQNFGAKGGTGIDFCSAQIKEARKNLGSSCNLIVGDFSNPSYVQKNSYDLVISVFSLTFISDLNNIFNIINQNLKPGGCVIISTDHPNRRVENSDKKETNTNISRLQLHNWRIPNQKDVPYVRYIHSLNNLKQAMKDAGFMIDLIMEPVPLPFDKLSEAPYQSAYFTARYDEILHNPYTLILKAYKPLDNQR